MRMIKDIKEKIKYFEKCEQLKRLNPMGFDRLYEIDWREYATRLK